MKHLLIFTKEYDHPKISHSGGTGIFYKNLAEKLADLGYEVSVFGSAKQQVSFSENGIDFYFVKDYFQKFKIKNLFRSLTGKFAFLKANHLQYFVEEKQYLANELKTFLNSKNCKPDIIETHDWEGISLFLNQVGIPFVVRCHGSWTVLENEFGYKKVSVGKKYCEQLAFQKSKYNIVISEFSKKINEKYFGISGAKLIYNGIDTQFFQPNLTEEKAPFSLLYLGNASKEKGAETALKAFAKIRKEYPLATLHFIGNPQGYPARLAEFLEEKDQSFVVFHGQKKASEIKNLLSKATLLFFPSQGENFSLSLLEAMAMGKIVVCNAIPAFVEIIKNGENGFVANSENDFSSLAIEVFKNNTKVFVLEKNARETIVSQFDINLMIKNTLDYYQTVIEEWV